MLAAIKAIIQKHSPHPDRVTILGACKAQPLEKIRHAVGEGLTILGNNYVQEGAAVREALPEFKGEWHFIGHIQSRKVRDLIVYDCVQSLDRLKLATALHDRALAQNKIVNVLIEINLGNEVTKSGIAPQELPEFLRQLRTLKQLKIRGLMGMPPPSETAELRRPHFKQLRALFDSEGRGAWTTLSMGTSEDYPVALEEGATLIRLGSVLFGARPPKENK